MCLVIALHRPSFRCPCSHRQCHNNNSNSSYNNNSHSNSRRCHSITTLIPCRAIC